MNKRIVNLTPHAITFVGENGEVKLAIEPSGSIARVSATTEIIGECCGIPITETRYGVVEGLPEPQDDTIFIVSSLVAARVNRDDVYIPNESVRDGNGRIIGCRSLGRV